MRALCVCVCVCVCVRVRDFIPCDVTQRLRQPKSYDLAQKQGLADFLKDADIRLVHTPGCSVESAKACSHPILPVVRENQPVTDHTSDSLAV